MVVLIQLGFDFFARETELVARELLGKIMEYNSPWVKFSGIVVEDEAYLGVNDPGSHSFRGKTKRNAVMFGPAGISYVYLIYGMYYCYNVTTHREDIPAAVLIRALQPLEGIEVMKKNRKKENLKDLCSGPGKLAQAMGIGMTLNGTSAVDGPVKFFDPDLLGEVKIREATRIGLTQGAESLLRFYVKDNVFVSRK
ncbi:MAG: DNA-3-methyladenine glycosylase [Desulfitobacteriaceae bacterium]|nr:DNA-3-methyladenine glycosylase [Desulfitobacteriaceae bacterium]MDD4752114.1 DNA-3-methyladenine glycosylase [Desulfitobacteriaceae bacterium]